MSDRRAVSTYRLISAASANATLVKAGPAELHGIVAANLNAAVRYLKLYDKATAPSGSDTPKLTIPLTGGSTMPVVVVMPDKPVDFPLGLGLRIVTGIADNDNTSTAANEQLVNLLYL